MGGRKRHLKEPVKSDEDGTRSDLARTLAPFDTIFRRNVQPSTPPPLTYRVPDTTSAPVLRCSSASSGRGRSAACLCWCLVQCA